MIPPIFAATIPIMLSFAPIPENFNKNEQLSAISGEII